MTKRQTLTCGSAEIELLLRPDGEFVGLGGVRVGGVALRSEARPILVRVDTPEGFLYTRLELDAVVPEAGGGTRLRLRAKGLPWGRAEYGDDYDQPTFHLAPAHELVEDELSLIVAPVKLELGGVAWTGFSTTWEFHSGKRRIHRLLEHATWELGGSIVGNTVLSQGQCNMPVYRGEAATTFTTACLRTLSGYGSPQGNSFQLGPRGGLLQGFDFQHGPSGAMLQFWPQLDSVSSLVESPPGSDLLHVVDEHRFSLSGNVATNTKWILFAPAGPQGLPEHEARDLWLAARDHVYGLSRSRFGIKMARPLPEVNLKYATRVETGPKGAKIRISLGGHEVDPAEAPYAIAEHVLPKLAAQGVRRFFPEVMSVSDVTEMGLRRKADDGIHGDLHCSSVCSTHRYFPSDFWGGIKAWRAMYDKAKSLGMELGAWFSPHFSPRTPIFERNPEYRMISVTGLPAGGGYGFQTLCVGDWNTGLYKEVLDDMRKWKEEGGLDYLFVDSLSNMGLLQANYAAAMRTNWEPLGRLFAEFQQLGIKALSCECISPWMISRFGVADLRGDLLGQDRSVAGQNDYGWWADAQDMAGDFTMFLAARKRSEPEMERFMFRHMAHRGYLCLENQFGVEHTLAPWWIRLNHAYLKALPNMERRRLLPDRAGTAWEDGRASVVWTFSGDVAITPAMGAKVEVIDGPPPTSAGGSLSLPAWGAYRIEGGFKAFEMKVKGKAFRLG
ncbi:MAG: hypothetical protein NTW19_10165 [Planctomycetota bacterium]|nr:hypothetical protein [Planctomycetota bacterium]